MKKKSKRCRHPRFIGRSDGPLLVPVHCTQCGLCRQLEKGTKK